MDDVFISYSSQDEASARALKKTLDGHGLNAWLASEHVDAGQDSAQEIGGALDQASAVVFLIGPESSHLARTEWSWALRRYWEDDIKLVPVVLDGADPPAFLHGQHMLTVTDSPADWEKVARALEDPATLDAQPLAVSSAPDLSDRLTVLKDAVAAMPDAPLDIS